MDFITILAQTSSASAETAEEAIIPLEKFWETITTLGLLEALMFVSFGSVCLFYGWRVFKILVVISFGLLGLVIGIMAAGKIGGEESQLLGGLVGMGVFAVLSVPLMRWAVCLLGAAAGGILTSGIWYGLNLNNSYIWAGALIGMIAGGMMSFIIFRVAVILFSSMGGSALIVVGVLALLYLYPQTSEQVHDLVFSKKWFLPVALMIPTMLGVILQNKFVKTSKEWNL